MTLQPLGSRILIQPAEQEKVTQSGLVIPDNAEKGRPVQGSVIAVGPGARDEQGGYITPAVSVGDQVIFKKYGPDEVEINSVKYLIADESDILAIIK
jgi:chaperonin GroES